MSCAEDLAHDEAAGVPVWYRDQPGRRLLITMRRDPRGALIESASGCRGETDPSGPLSNPLLSHCSKRFYRIQSRVFRGIILSIPESTPSRPPLGTDPQGLEEQVIRRPACLPLRTRILLQPILLCACTLSASAALPALPVLTANHPVSATVSGKGASCFTALVAVPGPTRTRPMPAQMSG